MQLRKNQDKVIDLLGQENFGSLLGEKHDEEYAGIRRRCL